MLLKVLKKVKVLNYARMPHVWSHRFPATSKTLWSLLSSSDTEDNRKSGLVGYKTNTGSWNIVRFALVFQSSPARSCLLQSAPVLSSSLQSIPVLSSPLQSVAVLSSSL